MGLIVAVAAVPFIKYVVKLTSILVITIIIFALHLQSCHVLPEVLLNIDFSRRLPHILIVVHVIIVILHSHHVLPSLGTSRRPRTWRLFHVEEFVTLVEIHAAENFIKTILAIEKSAFAAQWNEVLLEVKNNLQLSFVLLFEMSHVFPLVPSLVSLCSLPFQFLPRSSLI